MLEGVQRRATKQLPTYGNMTYEDRLRRLNLPSLVMPLKPSRLQQENMTRMQAPKYYLSPIMSTLEITILNFIQMKVDTAHDGTTSVTEWLKCGTLYQNM